MRLDGLADRATPASRRSTEADLLARSLVASVLGPAGTSDVAWRRAAFERAVAIARGAPGETAEVVGPLPGLLGALVDDVARHADRVTDEQVAALYADGVGEDVLIEVTIAAAVGAGVTRRWLGIHAIDEWEAQQRGGAHHSQQPGIGVARHPPADSEGVNDFFSTAFRAWRVHAFDPGRWDDSELIAAAVSERNHCAVCVASHTPRGLPQPDGGIVRDRLSPSQRAFVEFAEDLTLRPAAVGADRVERALNAGTSRARLRQTAEICGVTNTSNRLADAFDVPRGRTAVRLSPLKQLERDRELGAFRGLVESAVSPGTIVLVASGGDYGAIDFDGPVGWHFPRDPSGSYAWFHPPDSAWAIAHLGELESAGAAAVAFPASALWWLEHYGDLRSHLDLRGRELARGPAGAIYALRT